MVSIVCASPFAYITNSGNSTVSVIDTATNNVTATVDNIGTNPFGVAVSPDGSKVYAANSGSYPATRALSLLLILQQTLLQPRWTT